MPFRTLQYYAFENTALYIHVFRYYIHEDIKIDEKFFDLDIDKKRSTINILILMLIDQ